MKPQGGDALAEATTGDCTSTSCSGGATSLPVSFPPSADPSNSPNTIDDSTGTSTSSGASPSPDSITIERRGEHSAVCRWSISHFPRIKARSLWSRYFDVGGYDCRLLVYPRGDSQALPGYLSLYLQISSPSSSPSAKWDCFASYRLFIANGADDSKSVSRDSWHRFSSKKRSHGWCDFALSAPLLDTKSGFLTTPGDALVIAVEITVLHESVSFSLQAHEPPADSPGGKFSWKVHNFVLFRDMIRTQKIMSSPFPAGDCSLRVSVYQSMVSGVEHLSICLESKDIDKVSVPSGVAGSAIPERGCWCLFRIMVMNQKSGGAHMHKDSYGRFAADNKGGDNTSLGWNDYMRMADFLDPAGGFLVGGTAIFTASVYVIRESCSFTRNAGLLVGFGGSNASRTAARKSDGQTGRFTWRIENFTRLKDLLKKKKIAGLCIKSRRFQIGSRDCRIFVYPRGQSQPPCHLSVFLEVTDSRNSNDWSCFVSHRLSVVNQKWEEKSITKESQNRYSKTAKDWGWREFVTLTSLFDQDAGFLLQDAVVFSAEILILKESSVLQEYGISERDEPASTSCSQTDTGKKWRSFSWKVENFLSFKEIIETRKIFSNFFSAGGCELRIGVYESFDTICLYLESDQSSGTDLDKNYWVHYRMAVVNQKNRMKTIWKESSICTRTWNNSVIQFMKVSDLLESDAGFLVRDTVVFVCEILDCCPWFEFADLEALVSEDDQDISTEGDELVDSEKSEAISGDEADTFRNLLSRAGFNLTCGDNSSQPQVTLREKLLVDAGAIAGFLASLRVYLDDPAKIRRLFLPTKLTVNNQGINDAKGEDSSSPSLVNLLMGVKVLQQAIVDLLIDIMVECCEVSERRIGCHPSEASTKACSDPDGAITPPKSSGDSEVSDYVLSSIHERLVWREDNSTHAHAVQSSDPSVRTGISTGNPAEPTFPPETCSRVLQDEETSTSFSQVPKAKWPEQSEELLGLIIHSLKALDGNILHGCPEPRRRPQSTQKISLVLDRAPKHLQLDLIALVPKLVDQSEHSVAACMLLDHLQKPDADPLWRFAVFSALSQLEFGNEVWERVLSRTFKLLTVASDELLATAISFTFKAVSHCGNTSEAAHVVRSRLKDVGSTVPLSVLAALSDAIRSTAGIAEALLRDIDSDSEPNATCSCMTVPSGTAPDGGHLILTESVSGKEDLLHFCHYTVDVHIMMELLGIPGLFVDASQVFERCIVRGTVRLQSLAMVLEKRYSQMLNSKPSSIDEPQNREMVMDGQFDALPVQEDFSLVASLGELLSLSKDKRVQDFVRMLYVIMFKVYTEDHYRFRLLKGLVERATNSSHDYRLVDIDMDVLAFLAREEDGVTRLVLNMLREVAEVALMDRGNLWHQICSIEDENIRLLEERELDKSNYITEQNTLSQQLSDANTAIIQLKADLRAQTDNFACERKELSGQIADVQSQLEWISSEKDEQIKKLSSDRKALQDRLYEAEAQVSQLKQKRDELKKVLKEKNALAERVKSSETAKKRLSEELKKYATENAIREEIRKSLEDEVWRLTQSMGQLEGEKREKEEQVARCEAYIDGMEAKLQSCQECIRALEASLRDEMSRHAPLYGAGIDTLSMKELETLASIHEEGLRHIHAIQQSRTSRPLVGGQSGMFTPVSPPWIIRTSAPADANDHVGGATDPWFNQT